MKRNNKKSPDSLFSLFWLCIIILLCSSLVASSSLNEEGLEQYFVPRDQRQSIVSTEYGEISAVGVSDGINGSYYMQFITLEPNALFLPVILNADMVFYVQTGSGTLGLMKGDGEKNGKKKKDKSSSTQGVDIRRGDVYRLPSGTVFFIQSSLDPERHKLRICAIFANSEQDLRKPAFGPYSSIRDLVLGFNEKILQAAFQAPVDVIEEIISSQKPLAIVEAVLKSRRAIWEVGSQFVEAFSGRGHYNMFEDNKEKGIYSGYNILSGDRDVENCNGWSTTVTGRQLRSLRASNIGVFMVNLTKGAMMGPHWNPMASEIAIVLYGRGMIHVACPSTASEKECKSKRVMVEEGDVFVVPRYHPMAQMSFNNGSLVFFGFTTTNGNNHPQFLAGKRSVLQTFDVSVLAKSFGVNESTIGKILAPQHEAIILECVSCAEEEERLQKEAVEREKEEERKKAEEEAKKIEEERKRREEAKQREEEAKKKEEEAKKREEEEKRQEEEAREKEEEKKIKEEEEAKRREAEEKERKEHEAKKEEQEAERQEEEARKEAEKVIKEEEEKARQREEEARAEEERQREEQARQEEKRREEEKEAKKQDEEEKRRKEETARQEEERAQEEEAMREAKEREVEAERQRKERSREAAAKEEERRKEEERGREQHEEEEEEEESQQQQEEEAAGSHEQEETEAGQKEARYWPGGGGEGTILLRKTWTG